MVLRVWKTTKLLCLSALLLSGCTTMKRAPEPMPPPAAPTPVAFTPKPKLKPRPAPVRKPVETSSTDPAEVVSKVNDQSEAPAGNAGERLDRVAVLLEPNHVVSKNLDELVVSQKEPQPNGQTPGLFEEAILLNKLRGNLKSVPGLDDGVVNSAGIQKFVALLKISNNIPSATAAAAITAAMRTEGITEVRADFSD